MTSHDWERTHAEQRGDRFIRYVRCRNCGVESTMVTDGGIVFEDVVEPCDVMQVRNVMDE